MEDRKVEGQTNGRKGEWTKKLKINVNDRETNRGEGDRTERKMERSVNGQRERWKEM